VFFALVAVLAAPAAAAPTLTVRPGSPNPAVIAQVQSKMVKIYGAGGVRGLEAYQSGFLISPEGHVLTVWSHVLDSDVITATLCDGRKFEAKLVGADPKLEIAVLKIDAAELPCFDLLQAADVEAGTRVLAFSNLFGVAMGNEPASVQRGTISVKTQLEARRGVFETPYDGPVYVLDAVVNNPGAAGGALVTWRGELVGMLGKELRNALNNTWLNYAVPIDQLRPTVDEIRSGKYVSRQEEPQRKPQQALSLSVLGLLTVPDVLQRTPPYVDQVEAGSPAAKAGLQADDLVVFVGDHLVQSCKALQKELEYVDRDDPVQITVLRGKELKRFVLQSGGEEDRKSP